MYYAVETWFVTVEVAFKLSASPLKANGALLRKQRKAIGRTRMKDYIGIIQVTQNLQLNM